MAAWRAAAVDLGASSGRVVVGALDRVRRVRPPQAIAAGVVGNWKQASELVQQSHPPRAYRPRDSARWEPTYRRLKQRLDRTTPIA